MFGLKIKRAAPIKPRVETRSIHCPDLIRMWALDRDFERWQGSDFLDWILWPGHRGLVRIVDGRMVGFILYSTTGDYQTIEIHRLLVDPRRRREGHGSALIWSAIDSVADFWDSRRAIAWVSEMAPAAIRFLLANRFIFSRRRAEETHIVDGMLRDELLYSFSIPPDVRRGKAA